MIVISILLIGTGILICTIVVKQLISGGLFGQDEDEKRDRLRRWQK